ncbi:MAG: tRNA adenosine deaminase-associated protein [Mycobacteriales bacterium]
MSQYFAALMHRSADGWGGEEMILDDIEDLDGVVEAIRDRTDGLALLFVEEDDEYFAVVRVDGDRDARTFISDVRAIDTFALAARIMEDEVAIAPAEDDEDSPPAVTVPAGDPAIVADLGISQSALIELCSEEGLLPADVITAICAKAGCADVLEEIREG